MPYLPSICTVPKHMLDCSRMSGARRTHKVSTPTAMFPPILASCATLARRDSRILRPPCFLRDETTDHLTRCGLKRLLLLPHKN